MLATGEWARGEFVFLYPRDNARCETVVTRYAECLRDAATFDAWTLERVVSAVSAETDGAWVEDFRARYLDFGVVDAAVGRG